jgi:alkaline phosphatase D
MLGYVEHRTAKIWIEVSPGTPVSLIYWNKNNPNVTHSAYLTEHIKFNFKTIIFDLVDLECGASYEYQLFSIKKNLGKKYFGRFNTPELWKYRKPAPDFSFLTGSCSYFNEIKYDRPGNAYGSDSMIFISMAKENTAFMLWLGDAWYAREADFGSEWGLWYRASHDRRTGGLENFLKSTSHLAIWDDHDYGPNNEGMSYIFEEASRELFMSYFANPTYGKGGKGIYTKVSYSDVDVFMLDNRTWRSSDAMSGWKNGIANPDKIMYGKEQIDWLKNALHCSNATFKIIATGSQVLNSLSRVDCLIHFPVEYAEIINFLDESKIKGVVFLTGDRHHSEIIKLDRDSLYTLFDITVSPLTAGISKVYAEEINNTNRIENTLLEDYNFGRFSFSGERNNRKMTIDFVDKFGKTQRSWTVHQKQLGY